MSWFFLSLALYLIGAGLTFLVILFLLTEPPESKYPWQSWTYLLCTVFITVFWPISVPLIALYWLGSEVNDHLRKED